MAGFRDLFAWALGWLSTVDTRVTPDSRTFDVLAEVRAFDVDVEDRAFDVDAEDRVFVVEAV